MATPNELERADTAGRNDADAPTASAALSGPAVAAAVLPDQPWAPATLQGLRADLQRFAAERDWGQFHTPRCDARWAAAGRRLRHRWAQCRDAALEVPGLHPLSPSSPGSDQRAAAARPCRNLLLALVGEVGELAECFQWRGEVPAGLPGFSLEERRHVGEELSDCLLYLLRLADACGVDLAAAATAKMQKNAAKYPAEACRGSAAKYTRYGGVQQQHETVPQAGQEEQPAGLRQAEGTT